MPIRVILYCRGIVGFVPDWKIDIDWLGLPGPISSRQCSANLPIQHKSYANRDPILDWRCLVNPRKSRSILCNAHVNSAPIEAQTHRLSVANPMPIGHQSAANPMSIPYHFGVNALPIQCQSVRASIHRQSSANPLPIHCQSDAKPMSTRRQSDVNPMSIRCQSIANTKSIFYQSSANRMSI